MLVRSVLARVFVDSIDAALPLYEQLAAGQAVRRFSFDGVQLAWVGPFLLLSGPGESLDRYRNRVASVIVDDIAQVTRAVVELGGELIDGPGEAPNGLRLIARHPDGAIFEYLQLSGPAGDG